MKDNTPYTSRPLAEVAREQDCMRSIFKHADRVPLVFEAFAGMGVTAEVWAQQWPKTRVHATDLDEECVRMYNRKAVGRNSPHFATVGDALAAARFLILRSAGARLWITTASPLWTSAAGRKASGRSSCSMRSCVKSRGGSS